MSLLTEAMKKANKAKSQRRKVTEEEMELLSAFKGGKITASQIGLAVASGDKSGVNWLRATAFRAFMNGQLIPMK